MARHLDLIGIGPGNPDWITLAAVKAIQSLDVLFVVLKEREVDDLVVVDATLEHRVDLDRPQPGLVGGGDRACTCRSSNEKRSACSALSVASQHRSSCHGMGASSSQRRATRRTADDAMPNRGVSSPNVG